MVFRVTKTILNLELEEKQTFAYLHLMKEHYWQMLKKYFSIENWILCIKLVNVNKDRSLLVSSHICKIQEM